jgi:hypothetical protein
MGATATGLDCFEPSEMRGLSGRGLSTGRGEWFLDRTVELKWNGFYASPVSWRNLW